MDEVGLQLEVRELRLIPGEEWRPPSNGWRFIFLNSGTAYWLGASKPREMTPRELLIVTPLTEGLVRASQLTEAVLHWFAFGPDGVVGVLSLPEREWIERRAPSVWGSASALPSTHPLSMEMGLLSDTFPSDPQLVRRARALLLALRVLAHALPSNNAESRAGAAKQRFDEIISRMPDAELIQRSSEELAQLCGCTPRHFNRLFRVRFGIPTRARQTELRLLKACQMLEASRQPIAGIAAACGYRSLSLFNSLFRRRFGMTPSQWRERVAKHNCTPGGLRTSKAPL